MASSSLPHLSGLLHGHAESGFLSGLVEGRDADGLGVQGAVVPLAVPVGQVQRVGVEGLGRAAHLQQVGGVVAGHGPADVGGNHGWKRTGGRKINYLVSNRSVDITENPENDR